MAATGNPPQSSAPGTHLDSISTLIIGLETNDTNIMTMFKAGLQECRESGIDYDTCLVNPLDSAESRRRLERSLAEKKYDVVCVGFGLRGNRDFTPLFEQIVNEAVRAQPQARFAFQGWPNEIVASIRRVVE